MILSADPNPDRRVVTPPVNPSVPLYSRPTNPYYATHRSYLALRLVCRTWNTIITPFSFSRVLVGSMEASLGRLTPIANERNLRYYVKTYEYSFWREGFPQSLQQEYLYIQSLPSELQEEGFDRLDVGNDIRNRLTHYEAQLEFERSGEIVHGHLEAFPKFPNLERLNLTVGPLGASNLSEVPSRTCRWGPMMVQVFLRALGDRREQSDVRPIRYLKLEGLTAECFVLPPSTVKSALRGFETLHGIEITIGTMNESATTLLGRFIQNAKQLRSIEIKRVGSNIDGLPNLLLRSFISPAKVDMSCKARGPNPPPIVRWPELKSFSIREFIFTPMLLIEFVRLHPTLQKLSVDSCFLKSIDIIPCPHHTHAALSPGPGEEGESSIPPEKQTWQHVLRTISALRKEPLERVHLITLASGDAEHIHISNTELEEWGAFLTGKRTTEPETLESEEVWCSICNPDPDDELYQAYWGTHFGIGSDDSEDDLSDSDDSDLGSDLDSDLDSDLGSDDSNDSDYHSGDSDLSDSDSEMPYPWTTNAVSGPYGPNSYDNGDGGDWSPSSPSPTGVTDLNVEFIPAEEVGDDDDGDTVTEYGYGYGQADATQEDENEAGNLRDPNNDYGEEPQWDSRDSTSYQSPYQTDDDDADSDN